MSYDVVFWLQDYATAPPTDLKVKDSESNIVI